MSNRVVITGLGVASPIGVGVENFKNALINGQSGIRFNPELNELNFGCQVSGVPQLNEDLKKEFIKKYKLNKVKSTNIILGCMAGIEAWNDAQLRVTDKESQIPDWDSGCIFGTGIGGIEAVDFSVKHVDNKKIRKLGGRIAQQTMASGISAYLGGILGLGNQVTTNSSACSTGTEGIIMAYNFIKHGSAKRYLVGSSEGYSPYTWAPFDSMLALTRNSNDKPEKASCPMSNSSAGFVPASGAGALILEDLETAQKRGARIYAEILGGNINSGGHRGGGSMTLGNRNGVVKCITDTLKKSNITPNDIDLISGHLTSTIGDENEIKAWTEALKREGEEFPLINSLKSMIGHCLSASGSIETVALALQLYNNFVHPSLNAEQLNTEIASKISPSRIPKKTIQNITNKIASKISLGFGDVNACLVLKKWEE